MLYVQMEVNDIQYLNTNQTIIIICGELSPSHQIPQEINYMRSYNKIIILY
jgi:hypothetical protein